MCQLGTSGPLHVECRSTEGFSLLQVSNQCMALVQDDILVPTKDEPGLGYVRESSSQQYVPDVFYKVEVSATCIPL